MDQGLLSLFYSFLYLSSTDILKCQHKNINSIFLVRSHKSRKAHINFITTNLLASSCLSYQLHRIYRISFITCIQVRLYDRPFVSISSTPPSRNCVKFHLESSYKELLRTSKFGSKWTKI
jgi:hypothetical protein